MFLVIFLQQKLKPKTAKLIILIYKLINMYRTSPRIMTIEYYYYFRDSNSLGRVEIKIYIQYHYNMVIIIKEVIDSLEMLRNSDRPAAYFRSSNFCLKRVCF